jgi:methionine biosynthesis protein MetW
MTSPDRHSIGLVSNPVNPLRYDGHNADPFECTGILRSFLPARARVLDVGCGTGSLTNIVNDGKENEVYGIEPDETRAQAAKFRGIEVFCGILTEDYLRRRGPFDVVILADILEHLAEPAALLRLVAQGLKPGGMVLISVPNVAHWTIRWHLIRGRFDYTETGIMDSTHLRWFTLSTIRKLLYHEGYEILAYSPAAGTWLPEYSRMPWKLLPHRIRWRAICALANALPTLFACQHVLKARWRIQEN